MKTLIVLLIVAAAGYYFYTTRSHELKEIKEPVYAEVRVDMMIGSRQFEFMLFGKMNGEADCRDHAKEIWSNTIDTCPTCSLTVSSCKANLEPRYQRLFSNQPINTPYLSFDRSDAVERDGRMVIWGLTENEGSAICEAIRAKFQAKYKGKVTCIPTKSD